MTTNQQPYQRAAPLLLHWYDQHARVLPWRVPPHLSKQGIKPDPYHIWLSEIMLQQTTVATVFNYYKKFLKKWPTLFDLAAAKEEEVLSAWAGLGYYSRARNLKKCADILVLDYAGHFPKTVTDLKKLPGIGDYTAGAIAAFAFHQPVAAVDSNVERIIARLFSIEIPLPKVKPIIKSHLEKMVGSNRPGDFTQGLMDLGSGVCKNQNPQCDLCPLMNICDAYRNNKTIDYPVRPPKKERPIRHGYGWLIVNSKKEVFLRKRPLSGVLAAMTEIPTSEWCPEWPPLAHPIDGHWQLAGEIKHSFTHFHLYLKIYITQVYDFNQPFFLDGWWAPTKRLSEEALPTVMKKAIAKGQQDTWNM